MPLTGVLPLPCSEIFAGSSRDPTLKKSWRLHKMIGGPSCSRPGEPARPLPIDRPQHANSTPPALSLESNAMAIEHISPAESIPPPPLPAIQSITSPSQGNHNVTVPRDFPLLRLLDSTFSLQPDPPHIPAASLR
jgi:hypothetical protein